MNHDPLSPLARHDDAPVFDEPWQAQTLALAFNLIDRGQFSASQWSETLGAELKRNLSNGETDLTDSTQKRSVRTGDYRKTIPG